MAIPPDPTGGGIFDVEQVASQIGNMLKFLAAPGDEQNPSGVSSTGGDVISNVAGTGQVDPTTGLPGMPNTGLAAGGTASGPGPGPTHQNQDAFYVALLQNLGMPVSGANLQFMRAWNQAEGMDSSHFNPFATTQGAPGASNFNSVGVKSYTSFEQGVAATAQTLRNGNYNQILAALRAGNNPMAAAQAVASSPWGTGHLVLQVLGGANRPSAGLPVPPRAPGKPPARKAPPRKAAPLPKQSQTHKVI